METKRERAPGAWRQATEVLEGLRGEPSIQGALLVRSDGVCVAASAQNAVDPSLFGALTASGLAALRLGFAHLGVAQKETILVQAGDRQLVIASAGDDHLLVLVARPPVGATGLLALAKAATSRLGPITRGSAVAARAPDIPTRAP
ncbi:MAG TPA: roadblock/LC7 domain-containing protein [Candidatus Thermoplasmatota archaeon]|nr:roadblock/LC7 domain-containing protein [Candidatus Thermoplasmatota archaeon]